MVRIKYACNQDWHSMSQLNESTRFCKDCKKEIKDFTSGKTNNNSASCGHFNLSQVSEVKKRLNISRLGIYTASLLTILGVSSISNSVYGQQTDTEVRNKKDRKGKVNINGLVKDKENDEPLPFVNIEARTKDTLICGTTSDLDGKFHIPIDTSLFSISDIEITFSYIGYERDTINTVNILKDLLNKEVVINLETAVHTELIEVIEYQLTGLIEIEPVEPNIKEKKK